MPDCWDVKREKNRDGQDGQDKSIFHHEISEPHEKIFAAEMAPDKSGA
jgi:hypothetical protein